MSFLGGVILEKLRLYKVDINYIKYLYNFDKRVQYNPNQADSYTERRPYLGIVLKINNCEYFVPLEHPRKQHKNMKNNIYIFKIHNGRYGILGFNNMIPINKENLIQFDINKEKLKYKRILISQYHFCNKHIKEIKYRGLETYLRRQNNNFFKKVCCNFQLLERKSKEFIQK